MRHYCLGYWVTAAYQQHSLNNVNKTSTKMVINILQCSISIMPTTELNISQCHSAFMTVLPEWKYLSHKLNFQNFSYFIQFIKIYHIAYIMLVRTILCPFLHIANALCFCFTNPLFLGTTNPSEFPKNSTERQKYQSGFLYKLDAFLSPTNSNNALKNSPLLHPLEKSRSH